MNAKFAAYLLLLALVNVLCIVRWKQASTADRIVALLMFVTLCSESIGLYSVSRWHNNFAVYHLYNTVEFFLISLYFNYSINLFRKRNIGLIAGIAGVLLSILNMLFLQKITGPNSYFLLFEGVVVIIYCLLAFHQILLDEAHSPYRFSFFWISVFFMIYWSSTFTGWGYSIILSKEDTMMLSIFTNILTTANYAFYAGIAAVFMFYNKMIPPERA